MQCSKRSKEKFEKLSLPRNHDLFIQDNTPCWQRFTGGTFFLSEHYEGGHIVLIDRREQISLVSYWSLMSACENKMLLSHVIYFTYSLRPGWGIRTQSYTATEPCLVLWPELCPMWGRSPSTPSSLSRVILDNKNKFCFWGRSLLPNQNMTTMVESATSPPTGSPLLTI